MADLRSRAVKLGPAGGPAALKASVAAGTDGIEDGGAPGSPGGSGGIKAVRFARFAGAAADSSPGERCTRCLWQSLHFSLLLLAVRFGHSM